MLTDDPPTLILIGNGPGEIAGWVLPIARRLRERAETGVRLTLILPPSQFSSGREGRIAAASGLFDEIVPPARAARLALGWGALAVTRPAALLHLGGDLWVSRRLAARWTVPAFAYAETPLIARHQRAFERIFVASQVVAERLSAAGVEPSRLFVSGDPRLDDLPRRNTTAGTGRLHAVLLAGSRSHFFRLLFPLWAETALALRALAADISLTVAASPHLPQESVEEALAPWRERLARESINFRLVEAPEAMADADLVITIPGTTTMQVAAAPVAALVVVPLQSVGGVPTEGLWQWLLSIPLIGPALKRALAPGYIRRQRFVSLPNRLTGRAILPEVVGRVEPAALARTAAALLADPEARRRIEEALAGAAGPRGAAARIAGQMLAAVGVERTPVTVG
jgi:lipid-A-disaccharide synthase